MNNKKLTPIGLRPFKNALLTIALLALIFGCHKSNVNERDLRDFKQINLVANSEEYHPRTIDPTLINAFWTRLVA